MWRRSDVDLGDLFEQGGAIFRVVAIADEPTVLLEQITDPEFVVEGSGPRVQSHVITSPNFGLFAKLERLRAA
jgi:hypothetical protein